MSVGRFLQQAAAGVGGEAPVPGDAIFITTASDPYNGPGYDSYTEFTWTVPENVTKVSVVAIGGGGGGSATGGSGGGGGGGGGLAYMNNYSVTPGESITVRAGNSGAGSGSGNAGYDGADSFFKDSGTLRGGPGQGGNITAGGGGGNSTGSARDGGGVGGSGGNGTAADAGGGAGAGGYSGNGGVGGDADNSGSNGSGGGGGGGGAGGSSDAAGAGGGVFPYGEGTSGTGGSYGGSNGSPGTGGSGGEDGSASPGSTARPSTGGKYGGGGGGAELTNEDGPGGVGIVRIVWGDGETDRTFPSTNVEKNFARWNVYVNNALQTEVTGFDISSPTHVVSQSSVVQSGTFAGATWSADGTKFYSNNYTAETIFEYDAASPFDITSLTYTGNSKTITDESTITCMQFNPTGTRLFAAFQTSGNISSYDLSTAWDISTMSATRTHQLSGQGADSGIFLTAEGDKIFSVTTSSSLKQWNLLTAFDLSNSQPINTVSLSAQDTSGRDIVMNSDGTEMLFFGSQNDSVYKYIFDGSAYNLGQLLYDSTFAPSEVTTPVCMFLNNNGTTLYLGDSSSATVHQYNI